MHYATTGSYILNSRVDTEQPILVRYEPIDLESRVNLVSCATLQTAVLILLSQ